MSAAQFTIRGGLASSIVGLFLLLTPFVEISILLVLPISLAVICVGLSASEVSRSALALLGGVIIELSIGLIAYTAWILTPIGCGAGGGCLLAAPIYSQPTFLAGLLTVSIGVALVAVAAVRSRSARKESGSEITGARDSND